MENGMNTLPPEMMRKIHDAEVRLRERAGGKLAVVKAAEFWAAVRVEAARKQLRRERLAPSRAELLAGVRLSTKQE